MSSPTLTTITSTTKEQLSKNMSNTPYTYNFNPGPAKVPKEVLQKAQDELIYYRESGISVFGKHPTSNCLCVCVHQNFPKHTVLLFSILTLNVHCNRNCVLFIAIFSFSLPCTEMSHRSPEFEGIINNAENLLREVL